MEILLKNAINLATRAKRENDATDAAIASAYAAIATAEQLKRIADILERFVGKPVYDELADYHENAFPGESLDEFIQRTAVSVDE